MLFQTLPPAGVTYDPPAKIRRALPDRQIQPFDKRRVQRGGVFGPLQFFLQSPFCPNHRPPVHLHDAIIPTRLEDLAIDTGWPEDLPDDSFIKLKTAGFLGMFENNLELPFKTKVDGVEVTVSHLEISYADGGSIFARCESRNRHSSMDILDVPIPKDRPPEGWEWIEAYRYWVSKR